MRLTRYVGIYLHMFAQNIKMKLEYRVDFLLGLAATVLTQIVGFAFIGIVFTKIPDIRGWTMYEVAMIYGIAGAARGITEFLFDNVWWLSWLYVREARFDHILHRPLPPLFHFLADRTETHGLGNFLIGILIVFSAWHQLSLPVTIGRLLFLGVVIASGAVLHFAINLAFASLSFWIVDMRHILSTVDALSFLGKYPLSIYPRALQVVITCLLPYAFVAFFPAAFLMSKSGYATIGLAAPLVAAAAAAVAAWIFHRGLAVYESTGG